MTQNSKILVDRGMLTWKLTKCSNLDNWNILVEIFFHTASAWCVQDRLLSIVIRNTLWFSTSSFMYDCMVRVGKSGTEFSLFFFCLVVICMNLVLCECRAM